MKQSERKVNKNMVWNEFVARVNERVKSLKGNKTKRKENRFTLTVKWPQKCFKNIIDGLSGFLVRIMVFQTESSKYTKYRIANSAPNPYQIPNGQRFESQKKRNKATQSIVRIN